MEVTITIKATVESLKWDNDYMKYIAFSSQEEAVCYWSLRQNMLPSFTEEVCVVSVNPNNKEYHLIGVFLMKQKTDPTERAMQLAEFWKEGWYEGRQKYGKAVWDAYYKGVRDAQADSVYAKEFGQKYYPEIK